MNKNHCTAIIVAAGQGKRMGADVPKQYLEVNGRPVVFYTLKAFQESAIIDDIILVVGRDEVSYAQDQIVEKYNFGKVRVIVEGGAERYDSVWEALRILEDNGDGGKQYVFIHDGVRMLVDQPIIDRAYDAVKEYRACVVGMPMKDTVKVVDQQQLVKKTLDRNQLWQIQTPQVFELPLVKEAYQKLQQGVHTGITDDSMVVEKMLNIPVKMVAGSYQNIKITTLDDLLLAELFLKQ